MVILSHILPILTKKKIEPTVCQILWKPLNRGWYKNEEIYFYEFWSIKNNKKFETKIFLAMDAFVIFIGLEKSFLLPFSCLLIDLSKLWTKIFGLISYLSVHLKILHLVKNNPFLPDFSECSTNHILLFLQKGYFLPQLFF